MLMTRVS